MKRLMVSLLCIMLIAGGVSACGNKKPESQQKPEHATAEKIEEENTSQQVESGDKEEKTEKEDSGQDTKETAEKDLMEDMTMTVLKEQAGTRDYTALEELSPEPGSRIAVVVKDKKTPFWAKVKKGMDAAVKDINQKMGYKGKDKIVLTYESPEDGTDIEGQINMIDAVLSENPSVLCLAAIDMKSCEAQLETAAENDIPVVVLDSGVESELVNSVCATDNYAAGAEAARRLAEAVENQGQIAVMTHIESSETSQEREKGFTEEITKNHPEIEIVNISHENEETSMQDMADAVLKLYPEVKGYFCTNEDASNAVLDAVNASGKDVQIVGFDSGKKQKEAIKNGSELGVIVQNPYGMGYATVVAGIRADLGLENDAFINTGYQWIDSTNVTSEEYSNYLYD